MAFAPSDGTAKAPKAMPQRSAEPDPLRQPALANAMRLGRSFTRLAGGPQNRMMQPQLQPMQPQQGKSL